jgi:hypothetical protein
VPSARSIRVSKGYRVAANGVLLCFARVPSMKRKAAADPPGGGAVDLAAAVEAAKRKADARVQTIWVPGDSQGPQAAPETNFGSEEDARETLVSRGARPPLSVPPSHAS